MHPVIHLERHKIKQTGKKMDATKIKILNLLEKAIHHSKQHVCVCFYFCCSYISVCRTFDSNYSNSCITTHW